jgi:hypothetical protein
MEAGGADERKSKSEWVKPLSRHSYGFKREIEFGKMRV